MAINPDHTQKWPGLAGLVERERSGLMGTYFENRRLGSWWEADMEYEGQEFWLQPPSGDVRKLSDFIKGESEEERVGEEDSRLPLQNSRTHLMKASRRTLKLEC